MPQTPASLRQFSIAKSTMTVEEIIIHSTLCLIEDSQRRCNSCWLKGLDRFLAENPQEDNSSANYNHGQWTEWSGQMQDAVRESRKDLYQPLKPWQTRMVTILAAHFDSPLQCQLQTVEITNNERFGVSEQRTAKIQDGFLRGPVLFLGTS